MVRGLRKRVIGNRPLVACGICRCIDKAIFFDVDHKIPQSIGGPDASWNLWPLCLRHHRQKCVSEISWIRDLSHNELRCFSCNKVSSAYFAKDGPSFWCAECSTLPQNILTLNLEHIIKKMTVDAVSCDETQYESEINA